MTTDKPSPSGYGYGSGGYGDDPAERQEPGTVFECWMCGKDRVIGKEPRCPAGGDAFCTPPGHFPRT